MIENKQHRRIGAAKAILPPLSGKRRSVVAGVSKRRFPSRRSSKDINAIPAKVFAFTADHGLRAAGVAAAIGSAAFATVMISQNSHPATLKGTGYPEVFERAFRARSHQSQFHAIIDYNITGSISKDDSGQTAQNTVPASNIDGNAASASANTNNNYVLRFVHKEAALLQNNHDFYVVRRGTILPRAGKVLSIARLGNKWILVTATRIFTEAENNSHR